MASHSFSPTPEQLKAVFRNSVQYEILFTFGVPVHHPADYAQWEFINFSRLAHARLLYNFLSTPTANRKKDDVISEDYGFPARIRLLPYEDRDRFNKDLLHLSYSRLRHTPSTKKWPDHLLGNLLEPTLEFMRHVAVNRPDMFATESEMRNWRTILAILESGQQLEISGFTLDDGLVYIFGVGEFLPERRPRFTTHVGIGGVMAHAQPAGGPP